MASCVISHKYLGTTGGLVVFTGSVFNTDFLPSPNLGPFLGNLGHFIPQIDLIDAVPKVLYAGTTYGTFTPDRNWYIIGASLQAHTDGSDLLGDTSDSMWILQAYNAYYSIHPPIGGVTIIPDSPYPSPAAISHYRNPWGGDSGGDFWTPKTVGETEIPFAANWREAGLYQISVFPAFMWAFNGAPAPENWFGFHIDEIPAFNYSPSYGTQLRKDWPTTPSPPYFFLGPETEWLNEQDLVRVFTPSQGNQWTWLIRAYVSPLPVFWYPDYKPENDTNGGFGGRGGYPDLSKASKGDSKGDNNNWFLGKWI